MPALSALRSQYDSISRATKPLGAMGALTNKIQTTLPYLRQASSGVVANYGAQPSPQYNQTFVDVPQANQQAINTNAYYAGQAMNNYGGDVRMNYNAAWNGSFNPALQGGWGTATWNGDSFDIPNAVLQQVAFQGGANQSRWNPTEYFVSGNAPQANQYVNTDVTKQRIELYKQQHPEVNQSGALDTYQRAQDQYNTATNNYNNLKQELANTTFKETRNAQGQLSGPDYLSEKTKLLGQYQQQAEQASNQLSNYQSRGARVQAAQYASSQAEDMLKDFKGIIAPTTSNLKIKETYYPT